MAFGHTLLAQMILSSLLVHLPHDFPNIFKSPHCVDTPWLMHREQGVTSLGGGGERQATID